MIIADSPAPKCADFLHDSISRSTVLIAGTLDGSDVVDHHIGAAAREQKRMGPSEAGIASGPRDDGRFSIEP
jgi:hypothetical protein